VPLLKHGKRVENDPWQRVEGDASLPAEGPVLVDLARWQAERDALLARGTPVGVLLRPDEEPDVLADDVGRLDLVALDFPVFKDGRAYSSARILREHLGFTGELRAVGDVLLEQLHFMDRAGFDAFEIDSDDPERDWEIASADMTLWYQATGDGRTTVLRQRHG